MSPSSNEIGTIIKYVPKGKISQLYTLRDLLPFVASSLFKGYLMITPLREALRHEQISTRIKQ